MFVKLNWLFLKRTICRDATVSTSSLAMRTQIPSCHLCSSRTGCYVFAFDRFACCAFCTNICWLGWDEMPYVSHTAGLRSLLPAHCSLLGLKFLQVC